MNKFFSRLIVFVLVVSSLYWFFPDAQRDKNGVIVSEGDITYEDLRVSDCFNDKDLNSLEEGETSTVTSVRAVPCSMPHDSEIYATSYDLFSQRSYPSMEDFRLKLRKYCIPKFQEYVGIHWEDSTLDINYVFPLLEGWNNQSDRKIFCIIDSDKKLVGSVKGLGI